MHGLKKLPLHDKALEHTRFVSFYRREPLYFKNVSFFVDQFNLTFISTETNRLQEQLVDFQLIFLYFKLKELHWAV